MTNRRDFLQAATLAAGGLAASGQAAPVARMLQPDAAHSRSTSPLHAVLVEQGSPQALAFGTRLAERGSAPVLPVPHGDITSLWLSQIGPAWRRHPVALAGLTSRPALFCLEQLSVLTGLRVLFHAEHLVLPGGQVRHQLLRGAHIAGLEPASLRRMGPLWPGRLADAIAMHRASGVLERLGPSAAALEPPMPEGARLLVSWIIAPA